MLTRYSDHADVLSMRSPTALRIFSNGSIAFRFGKPVRNRAHKRVRHGGAMRGDVAGARLAWCLQQTRDALRAIDDDRHRLKGNLHRPQTPE